MRQGRSDNRLCADTGEAGFEELCVRGVERSTAAEITRLPLEQEAAMRIERFQEQGSCSIECPGYLDLFGNAWGCIVHGDGWAEILLIRDVGDGTSSVQTVRFETGS